MAHSATFHSHAASWNGPNGCVVPPWLAFLGLNIWRKFSGFAADYCDGNDMSQALSFVTVQVIDMHKNCGIISSIS